MSSWDFEHLYKSDQPVTRTEIYKHKLCACYKFNVNSLNGSKCQDFGCNIRKHCNFRKVHDITCMNIQKNTKKDKDELNKIIVGVITK